MDIFITFSVAYIDYIYVHGYKNDFTIKVFLWIFVFDVYATLN